MAEEPYACLGNSIESLDRWNRGIKGREANIYKIQERGIYCLNSYFWCKQLFSFFPLKILNMFLKTTQCFVFSCIYLFIYLLWLHWVFVDARRLSLVAASRCRASL